MTKFTDAEGNEVEGFTQEEVDKKVEEQVKKQLKESEEKFKKEKTEKEKEIADLNSKMEGLEKKGDSVADLRLKLEGLEKEKEDVTKAHEKEVKKLKAEIPDPREEKIKAFVGDDEEKEKKLREELAKFKDPKDDKEFEEQLKAANRLATPEPEVDPLNPVISSGGDNTPVQTGDIDPNLKTLGKNFGLDDKDFEEARKKGMI